MELMKLISTILNKDNKRLLLLLRQGCYNLEARVAYIKDCILLSQILLRAD